ncbi:hypothetical protein MKEN_00800300 [Mycena kentingensis (nom. inval.)]|nr:hypothetical protein MKEN_00800300 [Mycena kentingensis (nom. inval.)]
MHPLSHNRAVVALSVLCIALFVLLFTQFQALGTLRSNILPTSALLGHLGIDSYRPKVDHGSHKYKWVPENQRAIHQLFGCMERGDCSQNQTKVVILASYEFIGARQAGSYIGGETVWAMSIIRALKNMGYTILYATGPRVAIEFYHLFDDLVEMVIMHPQQIDECYGMDLCLKTETNPAGIPAWRIQALHFWQNPGNPLGRKWTLSPEDYGSNNYVGYSIEEQCKMRPFVPHEERLRQAYILAKYYMFFNAKDTAWPPAYYEAAVNETGIRFVMAASMTTRPDLFPEPKDAPTAIHNMGGILSQEDFYGNLSSSMLLVGVGNPALSPTPYDALCLGVPFLNVVRNWDKNHPDDRNAWGTQHDALRKLTTPHVYHVFQGDQAGFMNAIRSAMENPIERFVPEHMKIEAVEFRLGSLIEHDWKAEAEELLERRKSGKEKGALFVI